ncbi:MAG: HAD-IB family phosphatase [Candidatus Bathyarchaeia archaeon]
MVLGLIAFDMDGTLLDGKVIYNVGSKIGLLHKIEKIVKSPIVPYEKSLRIARLLKGLSAHKIIEIVEAIPTMEGAVETVKRLKDRNFRVGIISDSYTLATEVVARKLRMDFHIAHIANTLEIKDGVITGFLEMPMGWEKIGCYCKQSVCKRYHLIRLAKKYNVDLSNTVAIGDSAGDLCMLERAGIGILFNPQERYILRNADHVVFNKDLRLILNYL